HIMINAIIVDDEEKSRIALKNLVIKNCPSVKILELCESVSAAEKALEKHDPDLIFLDIEMPFENGFELLQKRDKSKARVIFVTAYSHYAIRAIKFSALDYLLKPVDTDELKNAVKKIEDTPVDAGSESRRFEMLLQNMKGKSAKIA